MALNFSLTNLQDVSIVYDESRYEWFGEKLLIRDQIMKGNEGFRRVFQRQ